MKFPFRTFLSASITSSSLRPHILLVITFSDTPHLRSPVTANETHVTLLATRATPYSIQLYALTIVYTELVAHKFYNRKLIRYLVSASRAPALHAERTETACRRAHRSWCVRVYGKVTISRGTVGTDTIDYFKNQTPAGVRARLSFGHRTPFYGILILYKSIIHYRRCIMVRLSWIIETGGEWRQCWKKWFGIVLVQD
jgi:hypothetical protein